MVKELFLKPVRCNIYTIIEFFTGAALIALGFFNHHFEFIQFWGEYQVINQLFILAGSVLFIDTLLQLKIKQVIGEEMGYVKNILGQTKSNFDAVTNTLRFFYYDDYKKRRIMKPVKKVRGSSDLVNLDEILEEGDLNSHRLYNREESESEIVYMVYDEAQTDAIIRDHFHAVEEYIFIIEGSWTVFLSDLDGSEEKKTKRVKLNTGETLRIPAQRTHAVEIERGSKALIAWSRLKSNKFGL